MRWRLLIAVAGLGPTFAFATSSAPAAPACKYTAAKPVRSGNTITGKATIACAGGIPSAMTLHACLGRFDPSSPPLNSDVPAFGAKACRDVTPSGASYSVIVTWECQPPGLLARGAWVTYVYPRPGPITAQAISKPLLTTGC
jgi:hypothetical protein